VPLPSQVEAGAAWPPVQLAGAQTVPLTCLRQAPEPLQVPSVPQVEAASALHEPLGSAPPAATGVQVPLVPGSEQDMQAPLQAVAQQTPCWHWPLAHSVPRLHSWPIGFLPHEPFWQTAPLAQSASLAQVVEQPAPLHLKGAQDRPAGGSQRPSPSQVNGAVKTLVAASQVETGMQVMPRGKRWQPPLPSHRPLVPQDWGDWAAQISAGSVTPRATRGSGVSAGTSTQRPSAMGKAQKRHLPVQASLQQTPSAQKPDLHWSAFWHAWPSPRLPQLPATQVAGATQSASVAQASRQVSLPHMKGSQEMAGPSRQLPRPSQLPAGTMLPPAQDEGLQTLPAA